MAGFLLVALERSAQGNFERTSNVMLSAGKKKMKSPWLRGGGRGSSHVLLEQMPVRHNVVAQIQLLSKCRCTNLERDCLASIRVKK